MVHSHTTHSSVPTNLGPISECQHQRVRHEHGTRAAYVFDQCRCTPCRQANTLAQRHRTRALAYGTWGGLVDADPVRRHLQALRGLGLSMRRISQLSGVGQGTISALVHGEPGRRRAAPTRVRADTARRLLALHLEMERELEPRVQASISRQHLKALAALGWTLSALAHHSGLPLDVLRAVLDDATVPADFTGTLARLHEQLRLQPPGHHPVSGSTGVTNSLLGQVSDGEDSAFDQTVAGRHQIQARDPAGQLLDSVAIERAMTGERLPLTGPERQQAVQCLTERGLSARRIAELLHTTSRTVTRLRRRQREAST